MIKDLKISYIKDYYYMACERIKIEKQQLTLDFK